MEKLLIAIAIAVGMCGCQRTPTVQLDPDTGRVKAPGCEVQFRIEDGRWKIMDNTCPVARSALCKKSFGCQSKTIIIDPPTQQELQQEAQP